VTTWATATDDVLWAEAIDTGNKLIITINIIKNRNVTYFKIKNNRTIQYCIISHYDIYYYFPSVLNGFCILSRTAHAEHTAAPPAPAIAPAR
jgi:hypothetical protein